MHGVPRQASRVPTRATGRDGLAQSLTSLGELGRGRGPSRTDGFEPARPRFVTERFVVAFESPAASARGAKRADEAGVISKPRTRLS